MMEANHRRLGIQRLSQQSLVRHRKKPQRLEQRRLQQRNPERNRSWKQPQQIHPRVLCRHKEKFCRLTFASDIACHCLFPSCFLSGVFKQRECKYKYQPRFYAAFFFIISIFTQMLGNLVQETTIKSSTLIGGWSIMSRHSNWFCILFLAIQYPDFVLPAPAGNVPLDASDGLVTFRMTIDREFDQLQPELQLRWLQAQRQEDGKFDLQNI